MVFIFWENKKKIEIFSLFGIWCLNEIFSFVFFLVLLFPIFFCSPVIHCVWSIGKWWNENRTMLDLFFLFFFRSCIFLTHWIAEIIEFRFPQNKPESSPIWNKYTVIHCSTLPRLALFHFNAIRKFFWNVTFALSEVLLYIDDVIKKGRMIWNCQSVKQNAKHWCWW